MLNIKQYDYWMYRTIILLQDFGDFLLIQNTTQTTILTKHDRRVYMLLQPKPHCLHTLIRHNIMTSSIKHYTVFETFLSDDLCFNLSQYVFLCFNYRQKLFVFNDMFVISFFLKRTSDHRPVFLKLLSGDHFLSTTDPKWSKRNQMFSVFRITPKYSLQLVKKVYL